jgi:hypothetical protein
VDKKKLFRDMARDYERKEAPNILPQPVRDALDDYFIDGLLVDPKTKKPVVSKMGLENKRVREAKNESKNQGNG